MNASDVMVHNVVTIGPDDDIATAVRLLVDHDISALPVVDAAGRVVGVLSEGDLLHREEDGTATRKSWWVEAFDSGKRAGAQLREILWPQGGRGDVGPSDLRD